MKLFVYPNIVSQRYIEKVKDVIAKLENKGLECYLSKDDIEILSFDDRYLIDDISKCDLILSLGGDGTFLRAARVALEYDMAICGINCGNLGYLCAYNYDDVDDFNISSLKIKEYPLLECNNDGNLNYAVNDVVIGKDYFGGTISLKVDIDDELLYEYIGDGLIVSTPLGSTAYNHSAGGEIINTQDHKLAVTPICPFTKDIKSVVTDDDSIIKIKLMKQLYSASCYIDGIKIGSFNESKIRLSDKTVSVYIR